MPRLLELLTVPAGPAVLDLLPRWPMRWPAAAGTVAGPAADPRAADELARALGAGRPLAPGEDDDADPTALVVGTSGSTGTPKGTLLPAGALIASARATRAFLLGADPRPAHWLLALPAHHVAGLQVLQRSLAEGTTPTMLDTSTTFTAAGFVRAAQATPGPVRLVSLVRPSWCGCWPTPTRPPPWPASTPCSSAARGPAALLDRAAAAGVRAVTTYGMSETAGGCLYDGRPLDGVVVATDPAGRLTLAGPVVAGAIGDAGTIPPSTWTTPAGAGSAPTTSVSSPPTAPGRSVAGARPGRRRARHRRGQGGAGRRGGHAGRRPGVAEVV